MRIVGAYLTKLLEDLWLILQSDADAGVGYRDLHSSITLYGVDPDPSSLRSKLHCIGQKIEQNLLDLTLITHEIAKPIVHCNVNRDAVRCGALAHKGACVVYR